MKRVASIDFKQIAKTELDGILGDIYGTVRSSKVEKYGISSYEVLCAGLGLGVLEFVLVFNEIQWIHVIK